MDTSSKVLVATVGEIADKEFNNRVTPPEEPKFQPEKYVLSDGNGKFDITGTIENFGTDYMFRVRIRLGFKVSQSIPAYIHQIMNDLSKSGEIGRAHV